MFSDVPSKKRLTTQERANFKNVFASVLNVDLMDHQVDGIIWMSNMENSSLHGGGLADDMGLGKTLQTIMCSVANGINDTLIVCPNALTSGWMSEFDKLNINIKRTLYHGSSRDKVVLSDYSVVITTYGTLVAESKLENSTFLKRQWNRVVLDESQVIKNHETKVAKACFALKSTYRWCLSGTPVQNNIQELFASLHFLQVPEYSDYDTFISRVVCGSDAQTISDIIFLRREKMTTLKNRLLKKKIIDYECPFGDVEAKAYNDMQNKMRVKQFLSKRRQQQQQEQEEAEGAQRPAVGQRQNQDTSTLARLSALRMGCNDVRFVTDCELPNETASSKQRAVTDLAISFVNRGKKVLIFSQYLDMICRLKKHIIEQVPDMPIWSLTGSQNTPRKRDPIISGFQKHQGGAILILQTMVGSVGLNLTQATRVILVEPWWNPFVDDQAMDRAHRIGQEQQVVVYRCFVPKTIEERILILQDNKRDMVKDMWGNPISTQACTSKLTKKEVRYLLGRAF